MRIKMVLFVLLVLLQAFSTAITKIPLKKMQNVIKIPTISKMNDYQILADDFITCDSNGDVFVLSRKNCQLYRFDSQGRFISKSFRRGEGPNELQFPTSMVLVPDNRLLIFDSFSELKLYELHDHIWNERKRITVGQKDIGKMIMTDTTNPLVLTSFSRSPNKEKSHSENMLHFFNIKENEFKASFFTMPIQEENPQKCRSTHGNGDIIFSRGKIFVVFNQPGELYILSADGKLLNSLSTRFPFTKRNKPIIKTSYENNVARFSIFFANNCTMNLCSAQNQLLLITRINQQTQDDPKFSFYLSKVNTEMDGFETHFQLENYPGDLSQASFKAFSNQRLVFLTEDFLYVALPPELK